MYSSIAVLAAGFAAAVNAYVQPVGPVPIGNAFKFPEQGVNVEAGVPTTVTWTPSTEGPVTIYICIGPSTNCVSQPEPIAVSIPNSGEFIWTPSTSLLPTNGQGYGLQLVVDSNGQYQYTPQFGVTNSAVGPTIVVSSNTAAPTPTPAPAAPVITQIADGQPQAPSVVAPITSTTIHTSWVPTGTGAAPSTIIQPTGGVSVPTNLPSVVPKPPTSTPPPSNGAGRMGAGMGAIFAVVLAAFAL